MATDLFDLVDLEQAFHHLEPRAEAVGRLAALVRPGGRLVISKTNGWNPLVQIQLFRRRCFRTLSLHAGHPWGHQRITVALVLIRQFAPLGFRKESIGYDRTLPNVAPADRLRGLERLVPRLARPLFTHYNLVLRKGGFRHDRTVRIRSDDATWSGSGSTEIAKRSQGDYTGA